MGYGDGIRRILGAHLAELRKIKNMSQVQLARDLGITQPFVSAMEAGRRPVPDELVDKLLSILGVSEYDFLTGPAVHSNQTVPTSNERTDDDIADLAELMRVCFLEMSSGDKRLFLSAVRDIISNNTVKETPDGGYSPNIHYIELTGRIVRYLSASTVPDKIEEEPEEVMA